MQKNPVLITDLRNDLKKECEDKFGEVRKVIVFDVSMPRNLVSNQTHKHWSKGWVCWEVLVKLCERWKEAVADRSPLLENLIRVQRNLTITHVIIILMIIIVAGVNACRDCFLVYGNIVPCKRECCPVDCLVLVWRCSIFISNYIYSMI